MKFEKAIERLNKDKQIQLNYMIMNLVTLPKNLKNFFHFCVGSSQTLRKLINFGKAKEVSIKINITKLNYMIMNLVYTHKISQEFSFILVLDHPKLFEN